MKNKEETEWSTEINEILRSIKELKGIIITYIVRCEVLVIEKEELRQERDSLQAELKRIEPFMRVPPHHHMPDWWVSLYQEEKEGRRIKRKERK